MIRMHAPVGIKLTSLGLLLFPIYFYFSGFHGSILIGDDFFQYLAIIKIILIAALLCVMLGWLLAGGWREGFSFFKLPALLVIAILISALINRGLQGGLLLSFKVSFIALFIFWLKSVMSYRMACKWLASWYSPIVVSIICLLLIGGFFLGPLRQDIGNGFGNSRGSFAIWLLQLICISFFSLKQHEEKSHVYAYFFVFLPLFTLQCIVANRTSIAATLCVSYYFFLVGYGRKYAIYTLLFSFFTCYVISKGLGLIDLPDVAMDPLRYSETLLYQDKSAPTLRFYMDLIDRYASYRLTIASSAFASVSISDLLFGVGGGAFKGAILRYPHLGMHDVHNVYLKMMGEYGFFAFSALFAIVINGIRAAFNYGIIKGNWDLFVVQFAFVAISMLHPDLLLTAISTSFAYIFSYALSINDSESIRRN